MFYGLNFSPDNNKTLCIFENIQDRNKAMMLEFVVGGMS